MRAATLILAAGSLAAMAPAHAGDMLPKTTTIVGTIATWTVAGLTGHPLDCLVDGPRGGDGWGARVQYGEDKELKLWDLGLVRRDCHVSDVMGLGLDIAPVVSVGRWEADPAHATYPTPIPFVTKQTAWDMAFVPMFHWKLPISDGLLLDAEVGAGPAYLSKATIGVRQKSTNFQFSDHLGLGLATRDGHWRIEAAYRHVSNANIQEPNNAVDFKGVVVEWKP